MDEYESTETEQSTQTTPIQSYPTENQDPWRNMIEQTRQREALIGVPI